LIPDPCLTPTVYAAQIKALSAYRGKRERLRVPAPEAEGLKEAAALPGSPSQ